MTRITDSLPVIGVFIPLQEIQCQSVPGVYSQSAHAQFRSPGKPCEVLVRYVQPETLEMDGTKVTGSVWLGLRPKVGSYQETLDWVLYLSTTGILRLMSHPDYTGLNSQTLALAEET